MQHAAASAISTSRGSNSSGKQQEGQSPGRQRHPYTDPNRWEPTASLIKPCQRLPIEGGCLPTRPAYLAACTYIGSVPQKVFAVSPPEYCSLEQPCPEQASQLVSKSRNPDRDHLYPLSTLVHFFCLLLLYKFIGPRELLAHCLAKGRPAPTSSFGHTATGAHTIASRHWHSLASWVGSHIRLPARISPYPVSHRIGSLLVFATFLHISIQSARGTLPPGSTTSVLQYMGRR